MLYMKEMRAKVVAECTLKESAAINQILGRRVSRMETTTTTTTTTTSTTTTTTTTTFRLEVFLLLTLESNYCIRVCTIFI